VQACSADVRPAIDWVSGDNARPHASLIAHRPSPLAAVDNSVAPILTPCPRPPVTGDTQLLDTLALLHLSCPDCGRSVACTPADARVYASIGPPRCCGRPLDLPTGVPTSTGAGRARRRPVRNGAAAEVRRAGLPQGPDLCVGLADVSADCIGVRLDAPVFPGEAVQVFLWRPGAARPVVSRGVAAWCRSGVGGTYSAEVRLANPLSEVEVAALTR